jgi:hypothetical protein
MVAVAVQQQPDQGEFQFYPTPPHLISQLIRPYYSNYARVLEPSAGRGDIADALVKSRGKEVYCCEISVDLRAILVSKGHKLIGTDFLTLAAPYLFPLIVMNPPFRQCAEHVLKAWEMLTPEGNLAAIVPTTAIGKRIGKYAELNQLIDLFGEVEEVGKAFSGAERSTDVECVIIRLQKPAEKKFTPFEHFEPNMDPEYQSPEDRSLPAPRDVIRAIVSQYQASMRALKLAHESETYFRSLTPKDVWQYEKLSEYAERIDKTKKAFWDLIFTRTKIGEVTTSGFRKEFMAERERLSQMEFSEETIYEVLNHFMQNRDVILGECIMDVFKQVTRYSMDNVTQHERWHTNKLHKITPKIIVPNCLSWYSVWSLDWSHQDLFNDLDKALTMFGGTNGICTTKAIEATLNDIRNGKNYQQKFESPNFYFRVFKKRTIHLWFRDLDGLEMINRFAAERELFVLPSGK